MPKEKIIIPGKFKDIEKVGTKQTFQSLPKEKRTFGQRSADVVTTFCGSWTFIIMVLAYIAVWVTLNLVAWGLHWDPWPFIILNLTLSCLAALQAPVILMSNNRTDQRDRLNQRYDYLVDRKTGRDVEKILKQVETIKRKIDRMDK
ncbi:DUF1003 domain-containing protein [Candidatus Kuenenbacteria bacterium]|nr:DUF1003 domain-containing protein [Candidatus Kuenenbacteria bacterium]